MRHLIALLILPLLTGINALGQNIYVHTTDGLINTYPLIDVTSITFTENVMNLNLITSDTVSWNLSVIDYYNYDQWYVSVPEGMILGESGVSIYPNPAKDQLTVTYTLIDDAKVNLTVYDMQGRMVDQLRNEMEVKGEQKMNWTPSLKLNRGTYILSLRVGVSAYNKLIILAD